MEAIGEDASIRLDQTRPVGAVRNGYSFFEDGDVAFAKVTPCFENGKAAVMSGLSGGAGFGTTEITVARPNQKIINRFLFYVLTDDSFRQLGKSAMTGAGGLKRVPDLFTKDYSFVIPSIDEQRIIVDFLDSETAQIDDLIGKQKRLIELLAEKRQAVITQAVTKGLDPNAPTKPSDTPWLGDVPMHWSVPKLGMHSRIGNGSTPSRENLDYWQDGTIPWLNSSHVNRDEVTDSDQFVTSLAATECHLPRVAKENLIVGLTGQGRTRGMASIVRFETTINQHVAYIAANGQFWEPEYLLLFLRAAYDQLRELSDENGSTKGALTCAALKNLSVCLPPLSEQTTIATVVNATLERIDSITGASQKAIVLLRERRSALISAAVTGKIDVREGVA